MSTRPFAEIVVNIEAPLEGTFHYFIPGDLRPLLRVGHMVEVEFGSRLAQGIIVAFDEDAPVEDVKPVIALIDDEPVVQPYQIALARWLSETYLAPLNGCLRQLLPPGLTRWSDVVVDIDPRWDGSGRLTEAQTAVIDLLRQRGDVRGRQLRRLLPKVDWQTAVSQLANRHILRKATILDPPRIRPKEIRTVELIASLDRARAQLRTLGRRNLQADVLFFLLDTDDPLPPETAVMQATGSSDSHLDALVEEGLVRRDTLPHDEPAETAESTTIVTLGLPPAEAYRAALARRGAERYLDVVELLAQAAQPVNLSEVYGRTDTTSTHLKRLAKQDIVRFGSEEVWRDPLADRDFVPATAPQLTTDQAKVWGRIRRAMIEAEMDATDFQQNPDVVIAPPPFLIHGVTGSGKTEIYMRAIEFALARGRQAVVLVPEIALTPQTVRRFAARFPGRVAVLHSRLSDGERYDTWRRARQGLFDIVVGPRSALFTPFPNLGVIVVDEEHDASYKQTPPVPPPYYHARETAVSLGQLTGATVLMGSATPDIVSYHRARAGRYELLELPKRVMGHRQRIESQAQRLAVQSHYQYLSGDPDDALTIPLPPIQVVDMRQELRAGNRSVFSRALATSITEILDRREQAILFLNRRGTASFVFCRDCGYVVKCPRCSMPLTYHRPRMQLVCHHCGYHEQSPSECPQCGSRRIKFFGLGTEQVEQLVQQQWPKARITRWDRDTTAGRHTHEQLLAAFINHESDILVGTQMIAKGLDLPLVTLVGVISADVSLGLPDYRTGERAFQNLTQVAGRAGRGLLGGRVLIQTYQPEHYAIQAAADHDFASFYLDEIRFRTQHVLPPFRRMARLLLIDPVNDRGREQAANLAADLRRYVRENLLTATEILGPTPPFFSRVDGRYRWQILVRAPDPTRLLADFKVPRPWLVDIDPESTL